MSQLPEVGEPQRWRSVSFFLSGQLCNWAWTVEGRWMQGLGRRAQLLLSGCEGVNCPTIHLDIGTCPGL